MRINEVQNDFFKIQKQEKTREQLILEGDLSLLKDGEIIRNEDIIIIPIPDGMDNPYWDNFDKVWYEKRDSVLLQRYERKVIETQELLDRYSRSGFNTTDIEQSLNKYKQDYNTLKRELNL